MRKRFAKRPKAGLTEAVQLAKGGRALRTTESPPRPPAGEGVVDGLQSSLYRVRNTIDKGIHSSFQ